jgi:glycogen debranching enzyme
MTEKRAGKHISETPAPLTHKQKMQRKHSMLTHSVPSHAGNISNALTMKNGALYYLCEEGGNVSLGGQHGFGLYYHDCRYLNGYELDLSALEPEFLSAHAARGFTATIQYASSAPKTPAGQPLALSSISIRWTRTVDGEALIFYDSVCLENFNPHRVEIPLAVSFSAMFEDIFEVMGFLCDHTGKHLQPSWQDGVLKFAYQGGDGQLRQLAIWFSVPPVKVEDCTVHFNIALEPRQRQEFLVSLQVYEGPLDQPVRPAQTTFTSLHQLREYKKREEEGWLADDTHIKSSSRLLESILNRGLVDLRTLRAQLNDQEFFTAGIPWFGTLFGRDSLIASLQMLAFCPEIAAQTLRLLAHYQGKTCNDYTDEQPGKILHELRTDEMTRMGQTPFSPFYGAVDTAPLFLILLAQYTDWRGSLDLFRELLPHVEKALTWMDEYGDANRDGYIEYYSDAPHGIINQGWKDAGNSILNPDGSLPSPPISLVEVQGYAYLAKKTIAALYQRNGDGRRAEALLKQAASLKAQFNRDFWLDDQQFYAMALQKDGRPIAVISSNVGQALWTGIIEQQRVGQVVDRLMQEDMFSGWGVRTLSADTPCYHPLSYHLGTVWPHDNSLIAAGYAGHGLYDKALKIFNGITDAAARFNNYRLPELFSGFQRDLHEGYPVPYPVACHPQAWAAGSVPFMLSVLLGLRPQGLDGRLHIVHPVLPDYVDHLELHRLRVGKATLSLLYERNTQHEIEVHVIHQEGDLEIVMEGKAGRS